MFLVAAALMACTGLTACQPGPVMAPKAMEEATYKILTPDSQGTAWAVGPHLAITAGHVCDVDPETLLFLPHNMPAFIMVSSQNHQVPVTVVKYRLDDEAQEPQDVCLLHSNEELPILMPLADHMPLPGERVEFVGYPMGHWVHSVGEYLGDIDGPMKWNNYATTAPCDHGASGSAMVSKDGVFGVLVRLRFYAPEMVLGGELGCVVSPLSQIIAILPYGG